MHFYKKKKFSLNSLKALSSVLSPRRGLWGGPGLETDPSGPPTPTPGSPMPGGSWWGGRPPLPARPLPLSGQNNVSMEAKTRPTGQAHTHNRARTAHGRHRTQSTRNAAPPHRCPASCHRESEGQWAPDLRRPEGGTLEALPSQPPKELQGSGMAALASSPGLKYTFGKTYRSYARRLDPAHLPGPQRDPSPQPTAAWGCV